jgi:hypothetical protein
MLTRCVVLFSTLTSVASVHLQTDSQPSHPAASESGQPLPSVASAPQQQQTPPAASLSPQQTQPGQTSGDNKDPKKDDPKNDPSTTHDRLFFALPNFVTMESTVHVAPLTAKQKFQVAVRSSFDYVQYPWYGVLAGISQAQNSETSYGQGAEGYAKR